MTISVWGETQKMAVVHLRDTGHVLGAATVLGAAEAVPSPESLAGDAIYIEGGPQLPRAHLATSWVAFKPAAIAEPTRYVLQEQNVEVPNQQAVQNVTLSSTELTFDIGSLAREVSYFVRVENDDENPPFERSGKAAPPGLPGSVNVALPFDVNLVSGSAHRVLIAVAGRPLFLGTLTP